MNIAWRSMGTSAFFKIKNNTKNINKYSGDKMCLTIRNIKKTHIYTGYIFLKIDFYRLKADRGTSSRTRKDHLLELI